MNKLDQLLQVLRYLINYQAMTAFLTYYPAMTAFLPYYQAMTAFLPFTALKDCLLGWVW
jgi:hypothetical protein